MLRVMPLRDLIKQNNEFAEELCKPNINKFENRKVHSSYIGNICDAHLADTQFLSKFNKGYRILLSVIDIYSK